MRNARLAIFEPCFARPSILVIRFALNALQGNDWLRRKRELRALMPPFSSAPDIPLPTAPTPGLSRSPAPPIRLRCTIVGKQGRASRPDSGKLLLSLH